MGLIDRIWSEISLSQCDNIEQSIIINITYSAYRELCEEYIFLLQKDMEEVSPNMVDKNDSSLLDKVEMGYFFGATIRINNLPYDDFEVNEEI